MSIVTIDELQKYTSVFTDDTTLQQFYLDTAQNIVEDYLGYSLIEKTYIQYFLGQGNNVLYARAKPINSISEVLINDISIDVSNFTTDKEFIYYINNIFPMEANIKITFNAGYTEFPEIFLLTILRIAALLQSESDQNIGVSSKSFGDSGTRTFINTVDYSKYLIQLSNFKLLRI